MLSLDDTPLPEARSTIEALRSLGLHVVLLSGDLAPAAQRVADAVGIDDMQAGLPPEAKRAALDQYRQATRSWRWSATALTTDRCWPTPMSVSPWARPPTSRARRLLSCCPRTVSGCCPGWSPWPARCGRTILTNLIWAFGYNLVALTLAALGILQPVLAAAVMAGSSLLLVVNSLRLSRLPDPAPLAIPERPPSVEPDSIRRGLGVPVMAGPAIERG